MVTFPLNDISLLPDTFCNFEQMNESEKPFEKSIPPIAQKHGKRHSDDVIVFVIQQTQTIVHKTPTLNM